jgi:hypothetical protein
MLMWQKQRNYFDTSVVVELGPTYSPIKRLKYEKKWELRLPITTTPPASAPPAHPHIRRTPARQVAAARRQGRKGGRRPSSKPWEKVPIGGAGGLVSGGAGAAELQRRGCSRAPAAPLPPTLQL